MLIFKTITMFIWRMLRSNALIIKNHLQTTVQMNSVIEFLINKE